MMLPIESPQRPRGVAYARIWSAHAEPMMPADIADALYGRGFMPGIADPGVTIAPLSEAGLADARFDVGGEGWRFLSMSSSRGFGCLVEVHKATADDLPDEYLIRRAVARPKFVYALEAGGPGNSDRNLCENIAEALLLLTNGAVLIGGLGVKGNRPSIHTSSWIGAIKAM